MICKEQAWLMLAVNIRIAPKEVWDRLYEIHWIKFNKKHGLVFTAMGRDAWEATHRDEMFRPMDYYKGMKPKVLGTWKSGVWFPNDTTNA